MTKFEQKKFRSIVRILKQVKSDFTVTDSCLCYFRQHGVSLKMTKFSTGELDEQLGVLHVDFASANGFGQHMNLPELILLGPGMVPAVTVAG